MQVSTGELVNDMRGYITDREDCCHRTCFSLQFNGIPLDHFAELRSIEGLKDGVTLKVVEEVHTFIPPELGLTPEFPLDHELKLT